MESVPIDVAVVGHFSVDSIQLPNRPHAFQMLGGSVAYVSLVAKRLEANVSVISRVGADFPEAYLWWLKQEGIDLSGVVKQETEPTTRFHLEYSSDLSERKLKLKGKGNAIGIEDLPANLRAKAIHVAPIAGEITPEVAECLKRKTDVLSFDPQGLLRAFDAEGNISNSSQMDTKLLDMVNVYKSSADEIKLLTGQSDVEAAVKAVHDHGVETVIVTRGAKGAVLSVEKTLFDIPSCKPKDVVDPTGAGDAFIGGFLTEFTRAKDSFWCACVGSAAAPFVVEGLGPTCLGNRAEIYARADGIYEK